ncbi:MAG: hypothetical protein ACLQDY_10330 [Streptosporangiaceae bacterium]
MPDNVGGQVRVGRVGQVIAERHPDLLPAAPDAQDHQAAVGMKAEHVRHDRQHAAGRADPDLALLAPSAAAGRCGVRSVVAARVPAACALVFWALVFWALVFWTLVFWALVFCHVPRLGARVCPPRRAYRRPVDSSGGMHSCAIPVALRPPGGQAGPDAWVSRRGQQRSGRAGAAQRGPAAEAGPAAVSRAGQPAVTGRCRAAHLPWRG